MRLIILLSFVTLLVKSAPVSDDANATIVKYENSNDGTGNYHFSFETSNGITREETGELVNKGELNEHIQVRGAYTYINPEGKKEIVRYVADENGYRIEMDGIDDQMVFPPDLVIEPISGALPPNVVASLLG